MMIKLYLFTKLIHRLSLYATSFFVLFMSLTGIVLKYSFFKKFSSIDMGLIRYLHGELSIYFVAALGVMMLTGLYMYLFPLIRQK